MKGKCNFNKKYLFFFPGEFNKHRIYHKKYVSNNILGKINFLYKFDNF